MRNYLLAVLSTFLMVGCNSVSGKIDGQSVEIKTAFMLEFDDYWTNDELIRVVLSGSSFDCEDQAEWQKDLDELYATSDYDQAADHWADNMPEDFWRMHINIRVDDVDDEINQAHDGIDWNDLLSDDDEAQISAAHYTDHPDEDELFGTDWLEFFMSDDGELDISSHSPGDSIRGAFSTTMVDEEGDDEGDVTFRFDATRCRNLEALWD